MARKGDHYCGSNPALPPTFRGSSAKNYWMSHLPPVFVVMPGPPAVIRHLPVNGGAGTRCLGVAYWASMSTRRAMQMAAAVVAVATLLSVGAGTARAQGGS